MFRQVVLGLVLISCVGGCKGGISIGGSDDGGGVVDDPDGSVTDIDAGTIDGGGPGTADAATADAWVVPSHCTDIPDGPFDKTTLTGFVNAEDIAFDGEGGHVFGDDMYSLYKHTYDGVGEIFVAGFGFRAGMRALPTGELVCNDDFNGKLVRVDHDGTRHDLLFGLAYPNGMEIDKVGYVYLTEQSADRVRRVDPFTGETTILVDGDISNPNGLTFDPTYKYLYIGAFSGEGIIYRLELNDDGTPGELIEWKTNAGTGWNDGMGVDECGNVYFADYGASLIYRIKPDLTMSIVVDGGGAYMPNYDWGSGYGGWDAKKLYIVNVGGGLFEVDMGVLSKPR